MMLQMVAAGRGVATLPLWLVEEYAESLPITPVRLGEQGIHKHIHLGVRTADLDDRHTRAFIEMAGETSLV